MPDVVRLRNQHGHMVELDHLPGRNPEHGDVVEVPGRLVVDMAEYRQLMDLPEDAVLGPDVAGYHFTFGPVRGEPVHMLLGWPKDKWQLVDEQAAAKVKKG